MPFGVWVGRGRKPWPQRASSGQQSAAVASDQRDSIGPGAVFVAHKVSRSPAGRLVSLFIIVYICAPKTRDGHDRTTFAFAAVGARLAP